VAERGHRRFTYPRSGADLTISLDDDLTVRIAVNADASREEHAPKSERISSDIVHSTSNILGLEWCSDAQKCLAPCVAMRLGRNEFPLLEASFNSPPSVGQQSMDVSPLHHHTTVACNSRP
jgi:hypothetical protein